MGLLGLGTNKNKRGRGGVPLPFSQGNGKSTRGDKNSAALLPAPRLASQKRNQHKTAPDPNPPPFLSND
jgi:hypothetical protein